MAERRATSVAIVRARYNPFGGAERFVQRALAALTARDVEVTVIARRWVAGDTEGLPLPLAFVKVDPFYLGSVWRDWSFARGVRRALARQRFDVVQSHERIAGVPVYRAGDGVHAEYLAQRRRAAPGWRAWALALNPYHRYVRAAERAMFRHPALRAVICNSTMVRDEIRRRFGVPDDRLHVIRNGVDAARFAPATPEARARAREALGLPASATVFAFVGSGFARKGLDAALHALARVGDDAHAHLVVAGTDRRLRRYRALADRLGLGARVHLRGGVDDVRPVLHAADAFVLPTLYDPFPNAVLEALACGLPTITSTKSGAAELIRPGVNGYVVDALDVDALADAMHALCDPATRAAMTGPARACVEPMTLDAMAAALIALYDRLLECARREA